jgi:RNA polymerase sigma factor (TIGR02999 family)
LPEQSEDITRLLAAVSSGDRAAEEALVPIVYRQLRQIAAHYMRREAAGHTLQTTALVNEAYVKLVRPPAADWQNRTHFFAVAANIMRRILVDHARSRNSLKRGSGARSNVEIADLPALAIDDADRILALDAALSRLGAVAARQARIVELRYFAGMTVEETATALDVSPRTVKREWQLARAWLYGELTS